MNEKEYSNSEQVLFMPQRRRISQLPISTPGKDPNLVEPDI